MANSLKGKFFVASREMYGDNSVKYSNLDLSLASETYDESGNGFNCGDTEKGSKLLASAMLKKIGSPTISRIYTNKYTQNVIKNITQDNWTLEAVEVAKWINNNTEYKIVIDDVNEEEIQAQKEKKERLEQRLEREKEREALEKEERRIQREKEFQEKIQEKLKERELAVRKEQEEHERKEREEEFQRQKQIESLEAEAQVSAKAAEYKNRIIKYQNELKKYKIKLNQQQNEIDKYKLEMEHNKELLDEQKTEIQKYKEFIKLINIPTLYKNFTNLNKS